MNMVEITAQTESADPLIINVVDDLASIGLKRFKSVGEFKYDWLISEMSAYEVQGLIKALQFAHALMETE